MSKFKVQFQKGMSLQQFLHEFGSEEQCRKPVYQIRWPHGFCCPACGHHSHCQLHNRALLECHRCQHRPRQWGAIIPLAHGLHQLLLQQPRGRVAHPEVTPEFHGRDSAVIMKKMGENLEVPGPVFFNEF